MDAAGWLTQRLADVPAHDGWLGARERAVLDGLHVERRRATWRLGRWTAKAALAAFLQADPGRVEVLAADDGAPEAFFDGNPAAVSVSLSHRGDRALAALSPAPGAVGCDLEIVESRSGAFIRDWLADPEQQLVNAASLPERPLVANLMWTGKEAAAKVRRAGLRLDVRDAVVLPALTGPLALDGWRPLRVRWTDGYATEGWWRAEPGWVMALAGEATGPPPRRLDA